MFSVTPLCTRENKVFGKLCGDLMGRLYKECLKKVKIKKVKIKKDEKAQEPDDYPALGEIFLYTQILF